MILEQIYRNFYKDTTDGENARALLFQTHWFSSIAELDPRTAEALPQTLYSVLWKITSDHSETSVGLKDRLWRITEHVRLSLEHLFHELNEAPHREHAILPIRAVRELDTTSFMAVARRPGRNIREKLAGKPYMLAVRRVQSVDLPENRLLKAFSEQLVEFLELRAECFGEEPDELIEIIHSWLQTDEAQSISYWDNVPPNNTLLTHRDYRAIYDAWCWLQSLDDDLALDLKNLNNRQKIMEEWRRYGQMYANGQHVFAEMPVLFDYDKFEIRSWTGQILTNTTARCPIPTENLEIIHSPVCVDLTDLHPAYAWENNKNKSSRNFVRRNLGFSFLWQSWQTPNVSAVVDVDLFKADVLYLHHDAVTVSAPDLFFSREHGVEYLNRAARVFVSQLHENFVNENLVWLQPDFLNDFELAITRRNINTMYPGAQPLPRSVAAVLEKVDYKQLTNGFSVVVLDNIGGVDCATKLEAKFDDELKKCLPETYGFYWERHPPIILSTKDNEEKKPRIECDIITLDEHGKWSPPAHSRVKHNIPQDKLCQYKQIRQFDSIIHLSDSPVIGGIKLYELQKQAGDIPLWRDQIPELSIKAMVNGRYQRFYLVSKGTTVKTIRGRAIRIHVKEGFTLPAGKKHYQFPLYIGEDEEAVGFSARLESADFPLSEPLECRLNLTFTYGEDDPYCLLFEPVKSNFRPIRVQWIKTVDEVVTNAPAPEYPKILSWDELHRWKDAQGVETDLLKWVIDSLHRLKYLIPISRELMITSNWIHKSTENGSYWYTFGNVNGMPDCYCNTRNFIEFDNSTDPNVDYPPGSVLYCFTQKNNKGISAQNITNRKELLRLSTETKQKICQFRDRSLQNRISYVWGDGRSLCDSECPSDFRTDFESLFTEITENLPQDIVLKKMRFLQACLHKDAPDDCVNWLAAQVDNNKIVDKRAIAFGLGNLSDSWQEAMFDSLMSHLSNDSLRVFAYAIWRHPDFIWNFSLTNFHAILTRLCLMLEKIGPCPPKKNDKDKWTVRNWLRSTTEPLELLLGLLRTRTSSDSEIKMLLQPHQKITKELAKLVENVTGIVAESHVTLFSRVQLGNLPQKPYGDHTPDLLYALRLYLTGDDGANAIQITGISDGDAE